ncbi:hypothetical protein OCU04_013001 [Sclerotinia nivalis]|uniref:Uncharacterized protein n=1 Tax=Sclerotinia nivalis TaxID=352851 RepID=A0A9X0DCU9_9HELO|nr:hypothetical protein OCU04_013001 [Sclerotinia nivalis]
MHRNQHNKRLHWQLAITSKNFSLSLLRLYFEGIWIPFYHTLVCCLSISRNVSGFAFRRAAALSGIARELAALTAPRCSICLRQRSFELFRRRLSILSSPVHQRTMIAYPDIERVASLVANFLHSAILVV